MRLKRIIIFYPSFERGGVETILLNLINFFLKKKIKIILISNAPKKKLNLIIKLIVFSQIDYLKLSKHQKNSQIFSKILIIKKLLYFHFRVVLLQY